MNALREPDLLASLPEAGSGLLIPAVVVLFAASVGAILWFRRKPFAQPVAPHEVALQALLRLSTKEYTELSRILRKYITDRFGIPALRQIPEETISSLKDRVSEEKLEHLSALLMNIECVMFSPDQRGDERDIDSVKAFVSATAPEGGRP